MGEALATQPRTRHCILSMCERVLGCECRGSIRTPGGRSSALTAATWTLGCESRGPIWGPGGRSSVPTWILPLHIYFCVFAFSRTGMVGFALRSGSVLGTLPEGVYSSTACVQHHTMHAVAVRAQAKHSIVHFGARMVAEPSVDELRGFCVLSPFTAGPPPWTRLDWIQPVPLQALWHRRVGRSRWGRPFSGPASTRR